MSVYSCITLRDVKLASGAGSRIRGFRFELLLAGRGEWPTRTSAATAFLCSIQIRESAARHQMLDAMCGQLPKARQRFVIEMLETVLTQASRQREVAMTTLEVKLTLPDQIAQEAKRAGLLNGRAIERLIEEAVRREAGKKLLDAMQRLREANVPPLTEEDIAEEVKAARATRKGSKTQ